jgi:hypothetical protein
MGNGRWDASDWASYSSKTVDGRSQAQVFSARSLDAKYDPAGFAMRESRDSADNPNATPIILASDVTGSMGMIAHELMKGGLNTLATEIYDRRPVTDPHIMVMAVGDAYTDSAPFQATQFEADIRVAEQTRELYIEGGGGGNGGESYAGVHLLAGMKTSHDAFEKRGRKGYLFTIGDEPIHERVTKAQAKRFLGLDLEADISAADAIAMANRRYEIFHVVIAEGYARHAMDRVMNSWRPLLPERTLVLEDHTRLAEVVVSAIQVTEGAQKDAVAASWSGDTSVVVANALSTLRNGNAVTIGGVRRL